MGTKEQDEERVVELYQNQVLPVNTVCRMTGRSYNFVHRVLRQRGIKVRGRAASALHGSAHPSSRLTEEERAELERELLAGQPPGELAAHFGLSRERVRQIGKRLGAPSGRDLLRIRRMERARQQDQRKIEREQLRERDLAERYKPWRKLWEEGLTVREIATELGMIDYDTDEEECQKKMSAVSVRIVTLRKKRPDWFPRRRGPRKKA